MKITASQGHSVFLCYSSADTDAANAILHTLELEGIHCWISHRDAVAGQNYAAQLVSAIRKCSLVVIVLSNNSIASPHVLREIETAVGSRKQILVLKQDSVTLTDDFQYFLGASHWLTVPTNFDQLPMGRISGATVSLLSTGAFQNGAGVNRFISRLWELGLREVVMLILSAIVVVVGSYLFVTSDPYRFYGAIAFRGRNAYSEIYGTTLLIAGFSTLLLLVVEGTLVELCFRRRSTLARGAWPWIAVFAVIASFLVSSTRIDLLSDLTYELYSTCCGVGHDPLTYIQNWIAVLYIHSPHGIPKVEGLEEVQIRVFASATLGIAAYCILRGVVHRSRLPSWLFTPTIYLLVAILIERLVMRVVLELDKHRPEDQEVFSSGLYAIFAINAILSILVCWLTIKVTRGITTKIRMVIGNLKRVIEHKSTN